MRMLLDTHAFLWWLAGDSALSAPVRKAIGDESNGIFVSAASAWEIATKFRLGKLPGAAAIMPDIDGAIMDQGFTALPIGVRHGLTAGALPGPHRDPFDRMLIAQAMIENLVLITNERTFDSYGVARLW
ncbi:MAG: type II toxin-antitoxin system VapC family toxin [Rhizomicrobium sp.]